MPGEVPLPALDPMPVPGPPGLFHVLWLVTFAVHVVGVNVVLGSSILGTFASLDRDRAFGRPVARLLAEVNTWAISLTITFGIAPLLFLQVLHGRLFYSATVILAPAWLGLLLFLMAAYYLTYSAKYRLRAGKGAAVPLALSALLFLAVAAVQVAVHLLSVQPGRWEAALASPWAAFADRAFLPRLLHFVLAGVTLGGILLAWLAVRRAPADADRPAAAARASWGTKVALLATVLQLVVGLWLTVSVPREVLLGLMRGGAATMAPFTVGIAAGFGLLVFLARVRDPFADRTSVRRSLELFGLAMVFMLVTRHQLRDLYVAAAKADAPSATAEQWGVFAIFLASFLLCGALAVGGRAAAGAAPPRAAPGPPGAGRGDGLRTRTPGAAALAALLALATLPGPACSPAPPPAPPPAPTPVPTREEPAKVGLALGGGGARGFAEIGVLRVLEQEKVPVSFVAGTSVGSLVGALYADTGRVLDAEFHAVTVTEEDLFDYRALAVFSGGFVKGERLRRFLGANLKSRSIEQMKVPFAAVAVDVAAGKAVVFRRGPVAPAVHASCAIPGVFVPVEIGGRTYVDGGVVNPVPADVVRSMGADVVVAVAIPAWTPATVPSNPLAVAYQSVMIMSAEIGRLRAREADVLVTPDVGDVAYDDFGQKKRLIAAGEEAARKALPALRAAIAAKTRRVPVP